MPPKPVISTASPSGISEVRYSLPVLLEEIQIERNAAAFTMEKLDQVEIGKLYAQKRPKRAIKTRK